MQQTDLFLLFTAPLDDASISYMVGGSVAAMAYGEPRLTNDIDLIIDLQGDQIGELNRIFPLDSFYCPPPEVITVEHRRSRRGHFNLIHHETGHKADVYTRGRDELQGWGLERRTWLAFDDESGIWLAPPEYVILRKLEYFQEGRSEKHVLDIRAMLASSSEIIDQTVLTRWVEKMYLKEAWATVSENV